MSSQIRHIDEGLVACGQALLRAAKGKEIPEGLEASWQQFEQEIRQLATDGSMARVLQQHLRNIQVRLEQLSLPTDAFESMGAETPEALVEQLTHDYRAHLLAGLNQYAQSMLWTLNHLDNTTGKLVVRVVKDQLADAGITV